MATSLGKLSAFDRPSGRLNAVIDTPKGSRNKYKFDAQSGQWRLSKVLPLGACFPFNFGFIPSTRGEDGDPLDVLVLMDEPAFPGCVVPARLLGVIEAEQTEAGRTIRNDRLVAQLDTDLNPALLRSLDELPTEQLAELEHFFIAYNEMEGRRFRVLGRHGPQRARRLLGTERRRTRTRSRRGGGNGRKGGR